MSVCNAIINISAFMMQIPTFNSQAETSQADPKVVFDCVVLGYCLFYDKRPQTRSPNKAP